MMSESYYPEFAALLGHHLNQRDRSAAWLARQLKMNPSTVTKWLNETSRPSSPELVVRIADILGVHDAAARQQLLLAAGYGYLQTAPASVATDKTLPATGIATPNSNSTDESSTVEPLQTTLPTEEFIQRGRLQRLSSLLKTGWLQWRATPAWRWASVSGLGLLFLLALAYPLLWEWPLVRISLVGALCLLGLLLILWKRRRRPPVNLWRVAWFAQPRVQLGAALLLAFTLGLWGMVGLPKLNGQWAYPGLDENGDRFGYALVSGDFDGDGYADLAASAVGESPTFNRAARSGWVYIFDNNRYDNLIPGINLGQAGLGFNEQDDRFGWALARGDFNGDGLDDLAVSAPGESLLGVHQSGYIYVFRGTPRGLVPWTSIDQHLLGTNEPNDAFGWSLVAADFNGDGKDDLAIGAPYEQPGIMARSGYVFIFTGRSEGFRQWFGLRQEELALDEDGDYFGWAMAAGDFNGDGAIELAVGAPGDRADNGPRQAVSGQVYIFAFNPKQGPQPLRVLSPHSSDTNADRFGAALAAGDFTGDGLDDLAVGAPGQTPTEPSALPVAGAVYLFKGAEDDLAAWATLDASPFTQTQELALFGWSLVSADFDGDHRADLAVGAPNRQEKVADGSVRTGAVFTFRGTSDHLEPWYMMTEPAVTQEQSDDWFGWAMTTLDLNQDRRAELVVSAPGGFNPRNWVAGYVYPYRFSPSGPVTVQGLQQ